MSLPYQTAQQEKKTTEPGITNFIAKNLWKIEQITALQRSS